MISSRKTILRAAELAGETVEVPLRPAPDPLTLLGAGSQQALMLTAEAEAQAIVAEAAEQREQVLRDAWSEGYEAGRNECLTQMQGDLAVVQHMVEAMAGEIATLPDRMAPEVTAMALEVAARIVRAELAVRPERIQDIVRGAIRRATDRERMVIYVNPEDVVTVREAAPGFAAQIGGISRIDVVEDPRVARGGCIVETDAGDVDARLATQFERLSEALSSAPDEELVEPASVVAL